MYIDRYMFTYTYQSFLSLSVARTKYTYLHLPCFDDFRLID
jgi:hypothetical protein